MREERRVWASTLRITIIFHLAAVAVWAIFARLDRSSVGYLFFPSEDTLMGQAVVLLLYATMPALFVCPVTVLAVAMRRGFSWSIAYARLAESLFCIVQLGALSLSNS